ncbi:MAG: SDR family oxidoreductase [Betaproteobacteria bacterium]|nr:MAG: SDR family oxidoreductase [Betaproteobacteria bacterium]
MQGRHAFIAGGAAGIGRATALAYAREGAKVVVADIDASQGQAAAEAVMAQGGEAIFVRTDVTQEQSVGAAVEAAMARFGRLDTLFNSAGGSLPIDAPITEVDMAVWDRTMVLDLKGTMHVCRHVIPKLIAAGGGTVVNMSSGAALRGSNPAHIYTAAKGAIVSLTRTLAGTYALANVRVNCICSGRIGTERVRRTYGMPGEPGAAPDRQNVAEQVKTYPFWVGEPEDIAAIALFLASHESRMITGAAIAADGGRSAY